MFIHERNCVNVLLFKHLQLTSSCHLWSEIFRISIGIPGIGAAKPVQVVQDHAEEFLEKMNSKVLAPRLKALGLIPESVKCDILQSMSMEVANGHLLNHLEEDADEESVREVFRIASEEEGYRRMKGFAASVLKKLQRGLYCCVH